MSKFTGQNICATYTNILNIGSVDGCNCCLTQSNKCSVTDSFGIPSSICIGGSGTGIDVNGPINGTSCITVGSDANISGTLTSGPVTVNGCATITGSGIIGSDNNCYTISCGDLYIGGTPSGRCITMDAATGNTFIKGTLNVGADESDTSINLFVKGVTTVTGEIRSCADIVAYSTSDCNLKSNLNKICNTQSIISGLSGYSFDWNDKSGKEGSDLGLMAQDVQEVLPSIVKQRDNGYLAVDYIKLIPVLIEEVKRLSAEVEVLKSIQTF